jgi:undecaprenyl-diphosphatase
MLFFTWKRFGKQTIVIALTVVALIVASDQSANLLKNSTQRLRPCHDPALEQENVITPLGCGGQYGFVSGHAANSAAVALFFFLLAGQANGFAPAKRKWWSLLFVWTIVVCWSRIYVGVHFPFDVLVGMLIGFIYAVLFFILYKKLLPVLR